MRIILNLLDGDQINYGMEKDAIVIGRSNKCDLVIPHEAMSRVHCKLENKDGELFITDLGSINGVYINGEKIPANSTIPFQTFLHLAFGAVTSAQIELDEGTKIGVSSKIEALNLSKSPAIEEMRIQSQTRTIKTSAPPRTSEPTKKTLKPAAKTSKNSLSRNLLAFIVIMVGLYFALYYGEETTSTQLPESTPAPTKVIENKDHF